MYKLFLILIISCFVSACIPRSNYNQRAAITYSVENTKHDYELHITDVDNKPLSNATVVYKINSKGSLVKSNSLRTNEIGIISDSADVTQITHANYDTIINFDSELIYEIYLDGYNKVSGKAHSDYGSRIRNSNSLATNNNPVAIHVKLTRIDLSEYFNPDFFNNVNDIRLKQKIIAFIDLIRVHGMLADAYLQYRSVNITDFKNKKYIGFKFDNSIVYNSLKFNKYDIAKNIYDDVIRKILTPLNNNISDPKRFYGYDITVIGHTRSFADDNAQSKPLEYRFYIPESAVRSYKDKDLSGQQLIDKSIILLDDERIDLKLQ